MTYVEEPARPRDRKKQKPKNVNNRGEAVSPVIQVNANLDENGDRRRVLVKRCPFCGAWPSVHWSQVGDYMVATIECKPCKVRFRTVDMFKTADRWNRRFIGEEQMEFEVNNPEAERR